MKEIMVITGATSGIGKQVALSLDKKEDVDEIWAIARSKENLEALQSEFKNKIVPIPLDLSDLDSIKEYQRLLKENDVNIKVLANCAGFGIFDHTENIDPAIIENMINLNCSALALMISYSLPYLKENSYIMNIASVAAFQPIPYINCYAATKSFVLSYSRALRKELKYRKIHVTAVTPFWTKTKFFDRAIAKEKKEVVIKYVAMYDPKDVANKAVKDLYKNKEISCYGFISNAQRILVGMLPKKMVMNTWLRQQKLDGTKDIRANSNK